MRQGNPFSPSVNKKRQHLRYFTLEEQIRLIQEGKHLLKKSGKLKAINAFRADSFGFNTDTLTAFKKKSDQGGLQLQRKKDGGDSGFMPNQLVIEPVLSLQRHFRNHPC